MIADKNQTITVEAVADGIKIYENPVGVLTNNPPFPEQLFRLNDFLHLSPKQPQNHFSSTLSLQPYSRGMGALGLPGDLSSQSRFIRAAFVRANSVSGTSEQESVSQFFHILGAVEQQRGCCDVGNGQYEITIYTDCYNAEKGIFIIRPTRITRFLRYIYTMNHWTVISSFAINDNRRTNSLPELTKRGCHVEHYKTSLRTITEKFTVKKPLTKITISDITADCGMNRMTFYYHFKDIYDLVEWVCLEDAKRALDQKKTYDTWQQGLLQILKPYRKTSHLS